MRSPPRADLVGYGGFLPASPWPYASLPGSARSGGLVNRRLATDGKALGDRGHHLGVGIERSASPSPRPPEAPAATSISVSSIAPLLRSRTYRNGTCIRHIHAGAPPDGISCPDGPISKTGGGLSRMPPGASFEEHEPSRARARSPRRSHPPQDALANASGSSRGPRGGSARSLARRCSPRPSSRRTSEPVPIGPVPAGVRPRHRPPPDERDHRDEDHIRGDQWREDRSEHDRAGSGGGRPILG